MKFSFFLFLYLVLIGISRPGIAQETEANRLLKEAEESRYTNPQKSLKLYNYLLKNTTDAAFSTAIEIKQIQANLLLENYQEAVKDAQSAQQNLKAFSNPKLYCHYWIQVTNLYKELDLRQESKQALEQAENYFAKLKKEQKQVILPQLELVRVEQESEKPSLKKQKI